MNRDRVLRSAPASRSVTPRGAGIGLRARHYREFLDGRPGTPWVEVHSENYFGDGGWDLHVLEHVRSHYPVSLHGVGLALGSADALARTHLAKLDRLVRRIDPALVSEHLCWGTAGSRHFNDLLPLAYTRAALALMADRVDAVQTVLGRRILVENVSSYVVWRDDEMNECGFLAELARASGCGILFDVNNLYVNAVNHGFDPLPLLEALPAEDICEIHLAGHLATGEALIDDHGSRVTAAVWDLYRSACEKFPGTPTLIEWDTDVPELEVLLDEARRANAILEATHA